MNRELIEKVEDKETTCEFEVFEAEGLESYLQGAGLMIHSMMVFVPEKKVLAAEEVGRWYSYKYSWKDYSDEKKER